MNNKVIFFACLALMGHGRRVQRPEEGIVEAGGVEETKSGESSFVEVGWSARPSPNRLVPTSGAAAATAPVGATPLITPTHDARMSEPQMKNPEIVPEPAEVQSEPPKARLSQPQMHSGIAVSGDSEDAPVEMDEQTRWSRVKRFGAAATSVATLPLIVTRAIPAIRSRFGKPSMQAESKDGLTSFMTTFNNLFAVWLALAAVLAVQKPSTFLWVKSSYFTYLLGALMFSVGITTTVDDFKACFDRPGAVAINFISCYGVMPAIAYGLAKAIGADGAILAGMVLVGSVNGGQASNLCTLIAGGDVALSVLMTTSTTLGCIFMTPLLCKMVLGSSIPMDVVGIIVSTLQVVIAPIFLGVGFNSLAPKICEKASKYSATIGVLVTVLLVGASVAQCAAPILGAGLPLQLACLGLHAIGGVLGYLLTSVFGFDKKTCRTVAIETAMKSSAFGFVLASLHFGSFAVRVPSAVSVVWMAITGSILAVYWQNKPVAAGA